MRKMVCLVGTYTVNLDTFELKVLLGAGILGYLFRSWDFEIAPLVLAMILGPNAEIAFRQSLMRSAGSFSIVVNSPISLTLIVVSCLLLGWNIYRSIGKTQVQVAKAG
jgi:putative tricarboxylic transport membrane protein